MKKIFIGLLLIGTSISFGVLSFLLYTFVEVLQAM